MDLEHIKQIVSSNSNLCTVLGMEFISTPEDDVCMARMRVDEHTRQPMGYLSGGASLALAESLAGAGSYALCPDKACVGIEVSASHVKAITEGHVVTATARLQNAGHTLHVWTVEIRDEAEELISTARVTNYVFTPHHHGNT